MFNTLLTKYIKFFRLYSEDTSYENLADLKLLTEKLLAYLIPGIFLIIFVAYFLANTITFFIVIATWLSLIIIFFAQQGIQIRESISLFIHPVLGGYDRFYFNKRWYS
jgi:hypothetical protein